MYKSDYDSFISNPIWKEIVKTVEETIQGLISDLSETDPFVEPGKLAKQQGRKAMAEFILALPEDILREINENLEKVREK